MNERYSEWRTEFSCFNCGGVLTFWQKMYSHGRCPLCGEKHPKSGTVVRCKETSYRLKYTAPWWKFWVKPKKVYWHESAEKIFNLLREADKKSEDLRQKIEKLMECDPPFSIDDLNLAFVTRQQTTPPAP